MAISSIRYNNIEVFYIPQLNGGGLRYADYFLKLVGERVGKVSAACEFCSGPGFIGFSLLAHGLCARLDLLDISPEAIELCQKTISSNNLESYVTAYESDCLNRAPANAKWDLVVGNPPHFDAPVRNKTDLLLNDPEWSLHRNFFRDIGKHLNKNATIILIEDQYGSSQETFTEMIKKNGLMVEQVITEARSRHKPKMLLRRAADVIRHGTYLNAVRYFTQKPDLDYYMILKKA